MQNDTVNFGYMTKAPVDYGNESIPGRALLDPNHSHFILVSSRADYITLRIAQRVENRDL